MIYFENRFIVFFNQLKENNNKVWFDANRNSYETFVKKPFFEFVNEFIHNIQVHDPRIQVTASDSIMRINKDIRFSKDKTPYKNNVAALISLKGKKNKSFPGLFFQISAEFVEIYSGVYQPDKDQLNSIREYIATNGKEFSNAYSDKNFIKKFGLIQGEKSKRIPAQFTDAIVKEPYISNKQFYFSAKQKSEIILKENFMEIMMDYYLSGKILSDFLEKAINI